MQKARGNRIFLSDREERVKFYRKVFFPFFSTSRISFKVIFPLSASGPGFFEVQWESRMCESQICEGRMCEGRMCAGRMCEGRKKEARGNLDTLDFLVFNLPVLSQFFSSLFFELSAFLVHPAAKATLLTINLPQSFLCHGFFSLKQAKKSSVKMKSISIYLRQKE